MHLPSTGKRWSYLQWTLHRDHLALGAGGLSSLSADPGCLSFAHIYNNGDTVRLNCGPEARPLLPFFFSLIVFDRLTIKSLLSFVSRISTRHCSHLLLSAVLLGARRPPTGSRSAARCCSVRMGQTDRRTDTVSFHRPCRIVCEQCQ